MVKAVSIGFIILLAIINLGFASASSYDIEFTQVGSKIVVKEKMMLDNEGEIVIDLPKDVSGFSANVNYSLQNGAVSLKGSEIEFSYVSSDLLSSSNGEYYFVNKLVFPSDFEHVNAKFNLDEGFVVDAGDIFPAGAGIGTDGRRIIVSWALDNVKKGESEALFVKFRDSRGNIWVYMMWGVLAIIVLIVVFVALIIYFVTRRKVGIVRVKRKVKEKKREKDYTLYLVEGEKKVIEELRKAPKNETWQKQLQIATGFSKAKMSRMVRNLESRGLIEKIPLGNTNKIKLKNYLP